MSFDMEVEFTASACGEVKICLDDCMEEVVVFDDSGQKVGSMSFRNIDDEYIYLTWMYLDRMGARFKRQGIGRECINLIGKYYDLPICASENDGNRTDDGSHLTGDAPAFIDKMRKEGLVVG